QFAEKFRPRGIGNAFGQTMIVNHSVHMKVFHADHPKAIDDLSRLLMSEVISTERDTLVHTRYNLAMLVPLGGPLCQLALLTLHTGKGLLFLAEKARIGYVFSIGESRKGLQANINTDLSSNRFKSFRLTLTREGDVPLASRGAADRASFHFALDGTMI